MVKYPVSAIHILKCHGLSLLDSKVEAGYALNCVRASQGMPTSIKGAKIACLDINLQRYKMQMGVQVRRFGFRVVLLFSAVIDETGVTCLRLDRSVSRAVQPLFRVWCFCNKKPARFSC